MIFFALDVTALQQAPDGIFIIHKASKKNPCEQELKMLIGGKKICTLTRPIIGSDGFEYATDILYNEERKVNFINLGLSPKSVSTLNQTIKVLPDTEFALVINADVICTFTIHDRMNTNYISLGDDLDTKELMAIRDALKKFQN